jgi:hypothetical protein
MGIFWNRFLWQLVSRLYDLIECDPMKFCLIDTHISEEPAYVHLQDIDNHAS